MYKGKKIIAVIPARAGSKRIKNKNIKNLNGKPLIYYSIKTALKCKLIDKIIVSTDDKKIAEIAKKYGAETPFLRPKNISKNNTPDQPVLQHALNFFKGKNEKFDYCVYLRPTAPLRNIEDINNSIKTIIKKNFPIVRSITKSKGINHPYWMYKIKNKTLKPLIEGVSLKKYYRSQLLPNDIVNLNGVVDTFSYNHIMKSNFLLESKKMGFTEIPDERAIDIDEQIDFEIAELFLKKQ